MENFTSINAIKEEPEDEPFTYINLSDNFKPTATASSYFPKPPSQIKTELEENEDSCGVTTLDSPPKVKEAKKRGRPKKTKDEGSVDDASSKSKCADKKLKQDSLTEHLSVKKRRDRFNGMPEEEVLMRLLPDILAPNLDILIIGINPGLFAAYVGHHYAGPGNHFWKCLYLAGLIPEPMNAYDDFKLPKFGIGFTNICARTTRGSSDLRKSEIKEGGEVLKRKIMKYRPRIAVFNGKGIYEVFSGKKDFWIGKQPEIVEGTNTHVFVMPSSSARCAQLPRASDKVPFFIALKKFREYLKGELQHLDESELTFPNIDMRLKPDIIKCEKPEVSECAAELTLEEIQSRAEYLEALEASAEGREIPAEKIERNLRRRLKGGSDDEDSALAFEDEESSQSSCSSDALRGIYNTDGSNSLNYGAYCYSKSAVGSSSFEVITPSVVKEEPLYVGQEDGGNRVLSPMKLEKEESKSGSDLRPSFSPKPLSQSHSLSSMTSLQSSRSSPLYTSLGLPKSQMMNTPGKSHSKSSNMASWQQQQQMPSHTHNYSGCDPEMATDPIPRQSSPYTSPGGSPHMPYQGVSYGNATRPSIQSATIPYHPSGGGQMPFGHSGPNPMVSPASNGQYKGRPPIHHQWSNGANSMPPPTIPHNGTYPYYGRGSGPPAMGQYPPTGGSSSSSSSSSTSSTSSSSSSPYKGASSMPPSSLQHNGMGDKSQRNTGGFNGPSYNVPNYYAC